MRQISRYRNLQDKLTSSVIELANCNETNDENTNLIIEGLFATITNVNFDDISIKELTKKVRNKIPCGWSLVSEGKSKRQRSEVCDCMSERNFKTDGDKLRHWIK